MAIDLLTKHFSCLHVIMSKLLCVKTKLGRVSIVDGVTLAVCRMWGH